MTAANLFPGNRTERNRSAHAAARSQPSQLSAAGLVTLTCVVAAALALFGHPSAYTLRWVLAGVTGGTLVLLVVAFVATRSASRRVDAELRAARQITQRGQAELQQMIDRLMGGEHPVPFVPVPARVTDSDPFRVLASDIERAQYKAAQGVLRVADSVHGGRAGQQVEIFVNLARRMQSLVHREIEMLDDLEAKVEDPDLLKGLFTVDHLATRLRRQSESLAVLGGSASRRQWTRQVTMHEVLRAAVAEVEQYSRVKVVPPVEGVLRSAAVTDVIHLIAELVENATKFSAPHTAALLRAQHVAAGLAIEVEDRGLGMLPADQQRMNDLLADPARMELDELLRDGRIGLYVVATLARRHGVRVQLQSNIYGGTQAVVVLPKALLDPADERLLPASAPDDRNPARLPIAPATVPTSAPADVPAETPQSGGGPSERPASGQTPAVPPAEHSAAGASRSSASSAPDVWATGGTAGTLETAARPTLPRRRPQASTIQSPQDPLAGKRRDTPTARGTEP
ncbi:MAG: ATP-binding protein, partial [Trebonia sp.]